MSLMCRLISYGHVVLLLPLVRGAFVVNHQVGVLGSEQTQMAAADCWEGIAKEAYRSGRFEEALELYSRHISKNAVENAEVLSKYYANRAQVHVQLQQHQEAIADCERALELDPTNVKAALRRGLSLENLGKLEAALACMQDVLTMRPPPSLAKVASTAKRRLAANIRADAARAAQEGVPEALVHDDQTLRLQLSMPLPDQVPLGAWLDLQVGAMNEFGLWRRDAFPPSATHIPLTCSVRAMPGDPIDTGVTVEVAKPEAFHLDKTGKRAFRMRFVRTGQADQPEGSALQLGRAMVTVAADTSTTAMRPIMAVTSLPVRVVPEGGELVPFTPRDVGAHSCRAIQVMALDRDVFVVESPGQLGIGGKVWDAGLVLLDWLGRAENRHRVEGKRVLELGSGTGLVGLGCAMLGAAEVTLTDFQAVVPLLDLNIKLNLPGGGSSACSNVRAAPLVWGTEPAPELGAPPDVIVMSDVVYDPVGYGPLLKTLRDLTRCDTTVWLAHRHRHPEDSTFFDELDMDFMVENMPHECRLSACSDVKLLQIVPKSASCPRVEL